MSILSSRQWMKIPSALLIMAVMALILWGAYLLDLRDMLKQVSFVQQEEHELKIQTAIKFQQQLALEEETQSLVQLRAALAYWQKQLVHWNNTQELIQQIVRLGVANQLAIRSVSPGQVEHQNEYGKLPVQIVVKGSYDEIAGFFSQIANLPWLVVLEDFIVSRNKLFALEEKNGEWALRKEKPLVANFVTEIYYLDPK